MVLTSSVVPMARAMLDAGADPQVAVFALVSAATECSVYATTDRHDLHRCAEAIAQADRELREEIANRPPDPPQGDLVTLDDLHLEEIA